MSTEHDRLTTFAPGEVEAVTGLSTVTQRSWRRHGYLSATGDGHSRFNAFDMARLMVMKMFSDRGVGPSETHKLAGLCSIGIVYAALQEREAYNTDLDLESLRKQRVDYQARSRSVVREYTGHGVVPARYFIWWADGSHIWHESLDKAFFPFEVNDPQVSGPVMVLDLNALGQTMLKKASKHFVQIATTDSEQK